MRWSAVHLCERGAVRRRRRLLRHLGAAPSPSTWFEILMFVRNAKSRSPSSRMHVVKQVARSPVMSAALPAAEDDALIGVEQRDVADGHRRDERSDGEADSATDA